MQTKISGASDDLIELEGNITDEVDCYDPKKPIKFSVSDGTIGSIFYNAIGEWKINIKFAGNKYLKTIDSVGDDIDHSDEDGKGCASYSDVVIFDEGVEWIKIKGKTYKD